MGDLSVRDGAPRVRLAGRPGVGLSTVAAALRSRSVVTAQGVDDADAVLYCFAGGLRATDRAAIAALDAGPSGAPVVAWTKADASGSWRAADEYAARLGEVLGRPVIPVMALLDAIAADDLPAVRRIAASGLPLPASALAAAEALGEDAPLLRRFGGYGLACALGRLRESPSTPDDALLADLRALSGVDALLPPLAAALTGFEDRREAAFDARLRAVAATDCARRDEAEQLLLDRLGRAS